MAAPLALPAAEDTRPRAVVTLGVLAAYTAGLVAVGGLVAAWIDVRQAAGAHHWPPDEIEHLDNYPGSTLAITAVLLPFLVAWAVSALRRGERRQSLVGLALTTLVGLAFLNALWYIGTTIGHGPGENAYALLTHAFLVVVGVMAAAAVVLSIATVLRVLGGQVTSADPEMARATACAWYLTCAAWIAVFLTVYVPDLLFK